MEFGPAVTLPGGVPGTSHGLVLDGRPLRLLVPSTSSAGVRMAELRPVVPPPPPVEVLRFPVPANLAPAVPAPAPAVPFTPVSLVTVPAEAISLAAEPADYLATGPADYFGDGARGIGGAGLTVVGEPGC